MKYIVNIEESSEPNTVRYWATVEQLEGCHIAEQTITELLENAPGIIREFIDVSNQHSDNLLIAPTSLEFRIFVNA